MKTLYVKDIKPGGGVVMGETFALADIRPGTDKNNRTYYDVSLSDKTGSIKGKIWADSIQFVDKTAFKVGNVVMIDARIDQYKGQPQLSVTALKGVSEELLDEYLQSSQFDADKMWDELLSIVESISDEGIRALLQNILNDEVLAKKLKYWPAAVSVHHDFRSGLLQHLLEMYVVAEGMERFYPEANFDIVKAGIFLHDIGKLEELDSQGVNIVYTKKGSLLGHMAIGLEIITAHLPENFPINTLLHLQHIVLSHHGELQYGSPVLPATVEALIVHNIDNVSADARKAAQAISESVDEEGMTSYNKWLSTRFWNGV